MFEMMSSLVYAKIKHLIKIFVVFCQHFSKRQFLFKYVFLIYLLGILANTTREFSKFSIKSDPDGSNKGMS